DLRFDDNVGFLEALKSDLPVLPIFIFDENILHELPEKDPRITFIYDTLQMMHSELQERYNSSIAMFYGTPEKTFNQIIKDYKIGSVFTNNDYEPYANKRDKGVKELLQNNNIKFLTFKDQVIFEKNEVLKDDGKPYVVYTPYMK